VLRVFKRGGTNSNKVIRVVLKIARRAKSPSRRQLGVPRPTLPSSSRARVNILEARCVGPGLFQSLAALRRPLDF